MNNTELGLVISFFPPLSMTMCKHCFPPHFIFQLQQLELAQIQQRDANLTALAAIGPRKKRPLESGSGNEVVTQCLLFYFSRPDSMPKGSKDMQIL